MTINVSGFGALLRLVASVTFPLGITITQFPQDTDAFDLPSVDIATAERGVNGDLITATVSNPLIATLGLPAGCDDDVNMSILFANNFPQRGRRPVNDLITIVAVYPQGDLITLSSGVLTSGMPGKSIPGSGKFKTKVYGFSFESMLVA